MIDVGFGNFVALDKIVGIGGLSSEGSLPSPIVRRVQEARARERLIDLTHGRKTRAVIFTNDGSIVLSSVSSEALIGRLGGSA